MSSGPPSRELITTPLERPSLDRSFQNNLRLFTLKLDLKSFIDNLVRPKSTKKLVFPISAEERFSMTDKKKGIESPLRH
ncbi:hypothetical protein C900_01719 [Fulvivirga imtechensis AK7]|uniref:Uncharacterized protein n=1 Tax=Fulvivirga imtechensis AK7 TaxID=1237149 RepID=L8JTN2_9BACT|nr:hypothetical protein C900_01719 [Fulvivirga imtechensis AK7]